MVSRMITQPETLVDVAEAAGIIVPPNLHDYDRSEYPFWYLYCLVQIDRPLTSADSHCKNACIVADIDPERVMDIGFGDIVDYLE